MHLNIIWCSRIQYIQSHAIFVYIPFVCRERSCCCAGCASPFVFSQARPPSASHTPKACRSSRIYACECACLHPTSPLRWAGTSRHPQYALDLMRSRLGGGIYIPLPHRGLSLSLCPHVAVCARATVIVTILFKHIITSALLHTSAMDIGTGHGPLSLRFPSKQAPWPNWISVPVPENDTLPHLSLMRGQQPHPNIRLQQDCQNKPSAW